MADPLVTVATYWSLEDCAVQRTALDAAAIENFADDYFIVNINWLNANAMRGIKLRVPSEALESAAEVLEGARDVGEVEPFEEPAASCESCGAVTFEKAERWWRFLAIAVLIMGAAVATHQGLGGFLLVLATLLITLIAPRRRCTECGALS